MHDVPLSLWVLCVTPLCFIWRENLRHLLKNYYLDIFFSVSWFSFYFPSLFEREKIVLWASLLQQHNLSLISTKWFLNLLQKGVFSETFSALWKAVLNCTCFRKQTLVVFGAIRDNKEKENRHRRRSYILTNKRSLTPVGRRKLVII